MTVSRLAHIPGIGVNVMGDRAARRFDLVELTASAY